MEQPEILLHALTTCPSNQGLPTPLLALLSLHQPGVNYQQVITQDLDVEPAMELPLVWITETLLSLIWQQREDGRVSGAKTRAELEARCTLLREGALVNAQ